MNNWIAFKDGLPNHDVDLLVTDGKRVVCARWMKDVRNNEGYTYFTTSSNVIGSDKELKLFDKDITHWMPLPEPPKP